MADTELRTAVETDYADDNILPATKVTSGSGIFQATMIGIKKAVLLLTTGTAGQVLTRGAAFGYSWDDAASGIPDGGTINQVLTKLSSTDGDVDWQTPAGGVASKEVAGFFTSTPITNEVITLVQTARAFTIPANGVGTKVSVGTNPHAVFVLSITKNGTQCMTISISTAGVVTLATTSGASVDFAIGDLLSVVAPATVDTTVANVAYTILGTLD